jgi:Tfp pilus assembly protein PilO
MSQKPAANRFPVSRDRLRGQLGRFRRSHRRGLFGVAEIIGLTCGAVLLLIVVVSYFYFLLPARSRVDSLLLDRDRLQKELRFSSAAVDRGRDAKATAQKITESLAKFEDDGLVEPNSGRMGLYEDLNQLIHKNGLRNTSGPTYVALEPVGVKGAEAKGTTKSAAAKWQSLYPGIAVSVTVEGQYESLRHFVHDLEISKQFLIINGVELEQATESSTRPSAAVGASKSGAASTLVSLRLDLATYFQRAGGTSGTGQ